MSRGCVSYGYWFVPVLGGTSYVGMANALVRVGR